MKSKFQAIKNHPKVACTTLLIIDFILVFPWCPERDLNSHSHKPRDFKSLVSTDFTIRAWEKNWRRVPESNRTRRICNPLHNRFANAPISKPLQPVTETLLPNIWSGKRDSNSRPRPWQGRALPTELFPHFTS